MHSESNNSEIMSGFDTGEITEKLFDSLVHRYQIYLEQSMRGSNFAFDRLDE